MPDDRLPEPFDGSGTILTEKRRKLLIEGDLDVSDSTIRRHKQEIRERFVDALIDLHIIANAMDMADIKALGDTVDERGSEFDKPVFRSGLSGLVAIGWMIGDGNSEQVESAVTEGARLGEMRRVPTRKGMIPEVYPTTAIEFSYGSRYDIPEKWIAEFEENPERLGREESALMRKTIQENRGVVDAPDFQNSDAFN
jgi:hypothetical protein